jgi:hypothetical protein
MIRMRREKDENRMRREGLYWERRGVVMREKNIG